MHAIHTTRSTTKKQKNEGPLGLLYVPSRVGMEKNGTHVVARQTDIITILQDIFVFIARGLNGPVGGNSKRSCIPYHNSNIIRLY